jgi:hypothetical protein
MNAAPQSFSTTSVTSQHFINGLDSVIVQLTQAFSVEHQITPDPDAKTMTRKVLQERCNILLTNEEKAAIKDIVALVKSQKNEEFYLSTARKTVYNVIKILGLEYVD